MLPSDCNNFDEPFTFPVAPTTIWELAFLAVGTTRQINGAVTLRDPTPDPSTLDLKVQLV